MSRKFGLVSALLVSLALVAQAADKKAEKEVSVKGEVVDVSCYLAHGAKGEGHKSCAEACAKAGGALGILTANGKLYVSLMPDNHSAGPNALLMDHIAQKVDAKGILRERSGVNGIVISSVTPEK